MFKNDFLDSSLLVSFGWKFMVEKFYTNGKKAHVINIRPTRYAQNSKIRKSPCTKRHYFCYNNKTDTYLYALAYFY